jgi:hypothetical protein
MLDEKEGGENVPIGFPFGAPPSLVSEDDQHTFAVRGLPYSSDLYCRHSVYIFADIVFGDGWKALNDS